MLFVARFTDKPGVAERRTELLPEHFKWLSENTDKVLLAGAMKDELDGPPVGGLWIIEADSKAEAHEVYQTDPIFADGLRAKVELYHWVRANPERQVTI